jgi:hypothetical protein
MYKKGKHFYTLISELVDREIKKGVPFTINTETIQEFN